jgi:large subunit ribosomal protein L15
MPHKLRKTHRKRGTRTVGYGQVGQHRKSGQKGYGQAGRHKHLWSYVLRYKPDYFLQKGFHSPRRKNVNVVNVGKLEELALKLGSQKSLDTEERSTILDLDRLGYDKLLGMGGVTKPLSIKVTSYSKAAAQKVEAAGGKLITEKGQLDT